MYYHKEKDVEITLHVDDFLVVGEEEHLLELKTALGQFYLQDLREGSWPRRR